MLPRRCSQQPGLRQRKNARVVNIHQTAKTRRTAVVVHELCTHLLKRKKKQTNKACIEIHAEVTHTRPYDERALHCECLRNVWVKKEQVVCQVSICAFRCKADPCGLRSHPTHCTTPDWVTARGRGQGSRKNTHYSPQHTHTANNKERMQRSIYLISSVSAHKQLKQRCISGIDYHQVGFSDAFDRENSINFMGISLYTSRSF